MSRQWACNPLPLNLISQPNPGAEKALVFSFQPERGENIDSFMSWVGGKRALRKIILACFPLSVPRYIEVFGGGGWVLFHKRPGPFEVYNDFNPLLANLFRCVRDKPEELKEALRYALNSREDFKIILELFARDAPMSDIDKAAKFYQLIRHSYAAGCDSFGCQPHNLWADFPAIDAAHHRLRASGVIVENKDFSALIRQYDKPESFFYLDPPYFGTERHYKNSNFDRESHKRLFDSLMAVKSKWLLSYGDEAFIRELYAVPGVYMMPVTRLNTIKQRYEGGSLFPELLIANYDIHERFSQFQPEQLMLA